MSTAQSSNHSSTWNPTTWFQGNSDSWVKWEMCCNVLLASYFMYFVYLHGSSVVSTGLRLSTILLLLKVGADVFFHLTRKPAEKISRKPYDWFIGIAGAYTILLFVPLVGTDSVFGVLIQLFGMALQVLGMFSLNQSIGFVAANRGIKTKGMYRFVRHPLYFAYTVSFFGFMINQFCIRNLCVYLLMVVVLYLRTHCEERILRQDAEYQEYAEKVKYRMIPGIF